MKLTLSSAHFLHPDLVENLKPIRSHDRQPKMLKPIWKGAKVGPAPSR